MPKIVDHDARRAEISHVMFKVLQVKGFENTTLRGIAREGGFSSGVLAHYFSSKEEMINFAFGAVVEAIFHRIDERTSKVKSGLKKILITMEELLPGPQNGSMAQVSMAFWGAAIHDPELRAQFAESYGRWRSYLREFLTEAADLEEIQPTVDVEDEIDLIIAATDGLLVYFTLDPDRFPKSKKQRLINSVLERLGANQ